MDVINFGFLDLIHRVRNGFVLGEFVSRWIPMEFITLLSNVTRNSTMSADWSIFPKGLFAKSILVWLRRCVTKMILVWLGKSVNHHGSCFMIEGVH
jgi:hypothetical protein